MAMGILGQLVTFDELDHVVYTVPVGKVAVFNIFATSNNSPMYSYIIINNIKISTMKPIVNGIAEHDGKEIKGIIGDAGTIVSFNNCSGIVTGYEEDA